MKKDRKVFVVNRLKKNYLVNLFYGEVVSQYYFPDMTKREISKEIAKRDMVGEACDQITFVEVKDDHGVAYLGGLKVLS